MLWAAACTDCVEFGVVQDDVRNRGALPSVAYPLPNLKRAAKRAMGCEVKHFKYDGNTGRFLATGLVEGDTPEWRVWAAGLPDLRIKGYTSEVEALVAVTESAAARRGGQP